MVLSIPLGLIRPSKTNPRKSFDKASLEELAQSIRDKGVLQPILVRPAVATGKSSDDLYELIAGERRVRAAKTAGLEEIPAVVRDFSDVEVLEVQVIENLQREDLHPLEEAEGYEQLLKMRRRVGEGSALYTVDDLAVKVGKSRAYIYARLKLCALVPEARKAFYDGKLNPSTALLVARIPVPELQKQAAKEIAHEVEEYGMSVHQAADYVQRTFMLRLAEAPWPVADAQLLPAAGACTVCPKRTGNQRELFDDVKSADVCTDPKCFGEKKVAWAAKVRGEAEAAGRTIISGKEAKKIVPHEHSGRLEGGYVDLSERCYEDPKDRNYRALLGKAAAEAVLLEDPHTGQLREVMQKAQVTKALKEKGHAFATARTSQSIPDREYQAERQRNRLKGKVLEGTAAAAIEEIGRKAEQDKTSAKALEVLATVAFEGGFEDVLERKGDKVFSSASATSTTKAVIGGMKEPQLRALVLEAMLEASTHGLGASWAPKYPHELVKTCEAYKVDLKKLEARVKAAMKKAAPPSKAKTTKKAGKK